MSIASGAMGAPTGTVRSPFQTSLARRRRRAARYLREPEVKYAGGFFLLLILFCYFGPTILNLPGPNSGLLGAKYFEEHLFSPGHIFGTDATGNDILSRLLHGGQVSIQVGLGATAIGFVIGSLLGTFAGYLGGWVDAVVMRFLDIQLAFPGLILALAIATYLGPSEVHVIFALSFFSVPGYARLTRANALRIRERDFIAASRAMGGSIWHIMRRHMSPNIIPSMLTFAFLQVGQAILAEAGLSFLGAGVPLPQPTWGNMIQEGQTYLAVRPDFVLIPGGMLFFTILSCNLLANGLRNVASSESE
jgi:peptide/nickel transport system permease protein